MSRRIYLAARYLAAPLMREWRAEFEARGHTVTSRWLAGKVAQNDDERKQYAAEDIEDLKSACTLVVHNDPEHFGTGWGGRHVEYGLAIAWEKDVFIVGGRENIFHHLEGVHIFDTFGDLVNAL